MTHERIVQSLLGLMAAAVVVTSGVVIYTSVSVYRGAMAVQTKTMDVLSRVEHVTETAGKVVTNPVQTGIDTGIEAYQQWQKYRKGKGSKE